MIVRGMVVAVPKSVTVHWVGPAKHVKKMFVLWVVWPVPGVANVWAAFVNAHRGFWGPPVNPKNKYPWNAVGLATKNASICPWPTTVRSIANRFNPLKLV